jgi:hypothetical protein
MGLDHAGERLAPGHLVCRHVLSLVSTPRKAGREIQLLTNACAAAATMASVTRTVSSSGGA